MSNKNTRKQKKQNVAAISSDGWGELISKRLIEASFILLIAVAAFLSLALVSYNKADPGWSHWTMSQHVANVAGRAGAWFADIFLYLLGYIAYTVPLLILSSAIALLREREHWQFDYRLFILRAAGFIFILIGGCGLASLQFWDVSWHLPLSSGGVLGNVIGFGVAKLFSVIGSSIMLVAVLLVGLTLLTGVSWLNVFEGLGRVTLRCTSRLIQALYDAKCVLQDRYYQMRDDMAERKLQRQQDTQAANEAAAEDEYQSYKPVIHRQQAAVSNEVPAADPEYVEAQAQATANNNEAGEFVAPGNPVPKINKPTDPIEPPKSASKKSTIFSAPKNDSMPPISLLDKADHSNRRGFSNAKLEDMSREVEQRLLDFGVDVQVVAVHPGPVITRFELQLAPGVKVSKLTGLAKDLARSLSVISVRVVEVIPGKPVVGIELPNEDREIVRLSEVLYSDRYERAKSPISLALGKDIAGHPVIVNLAKMPHLLVAGTTGSGKSVGVNAMILSILLKASPRDVRMIMVDPKMLELAIYDGIPHLLAPVVTDMKEAANALRWCVAEMERRYRLMASLGVRNLASFNQKVEAAEKVGKPLTDPLWKGPEEMQAPELQTLPTIVVVIDEFADMMMVVGKKVEQLIARIAQKARAAGIHLILATQRPSVDVITGLIKSNIPTRIAFQVSSKIDSRTILDQQGAEQLLGYGDMLYLPPGSGTPVRVHGAFVDDDEVHRVVDDWKSRGEPVYIDEIVDGPSETGDVFIPGDDEDASTEDTDPLYDQVVDFVARGRKVSISSVQRRFKIGYNRAARLVEEMERTGVVSAMESNGSREVLVPPVAE